MQINRANTTISWYQVSIRLQSLIIKFQNYQKDNFGATYQKYVYCSTVLGSWTMGKNVKNFQVKNKLQVPMSLHILKLLILGNL